MLLLGATMRMMMTMMVKCECFSKQWTWATPAQNDSTCAKRKDLVSLRHVQYIATSSCRFDGVPLAPA